MNEKSLLRISELSNRAGVTPRTVRFYIQQGLLPQPVYKRKNMALYSPKCVDQIRAIKKAQSERFLPLVTIRKMLEQSRYDYSVLEHATDLFARNPAGVLKTKIHSGQRKRSPVPPEVIDYLSNKNLIQPLKNRRPGRIFPANDRQLLDLLSLFHENGADWHYLMASLDGIQSLVGKIVALEFNGLISLIMNNPTEDFYDLLALEEHTLQSVINRARQNALKNLVARHKNELDNAFLASADEGFAVQAETIAPDLQTLEKQLKSRPHDIRLLNDLALGYSCLGDLDSSLRYLRRIKKIAPDDLETCVRWIWYRRFSRQSNAQIRLKSQLRNLVQANPDYPIGRAFIAIWYAFDIQDTDDPNETFRLMNLCLQELEAVEKQMPEDLHEQALIHYIKGRIYMYFPPSANNLEDGLQAFEWIKQHRKAIDKYYAGQKAFFPKWLWPNLNYFLGVSYIRTGQHQQAYDLLCHGRTYKLQPPYRERLEAAIEAARTGNMPATAKMPE
jgi:DNA-binding transcriptional MerR regulator